MAQIYSGASFVLVWLGISAEGQRSLAYVKRALRFRSRDSQKIEAHFSQLESSFRDLVALPWFSRRWIIQEVVLAADVTMMCCLEEISLIDLFRVMNGLSRNSELPSALAPLAAISKLWKTWVFDSNPEGGLRLFELLSLFHESDCQVDLDRIYALCHLASDCVIVEKQGEAPDDKVSVVVDYSQTADCLYQSVVEQLLGLEVNAEGVTKETRRRPQVSAPGIDHFQEVLGAVAERCDGSNRNAMVWVPDWRLPKRREPISESFDCVSVLHDKFDMVVERVHHKKKDPHASFNVVNSVLQPFPEHPHIAEFKNWLREMRDRFVDKQTRSFVEKFVLHQNKETLDFLIKNSFLSYDRTQMSPACVWYTFLFFILKEGTRWRSARGSMDAVKDNVRNLYLLSLGESDVQISTECWSFLCSLFRGRRIFSWGQGRHAHERMSGLGFGPDHLEAGAFFDIPLRRTTREERRIDQTLLWYTVAKQGLAFVGDAGVYQLVDEYNDGTFTKYKNIIL